MKTLQNYIFEESKTFDSKVPTNIYKICDQLTRHVDYSKLQEINDDDPNRFDKSKENEQQFIDSFTNSNTEYKALGTQEYYALINPNSKWETLSDKEKADFDAKNGDIIILDKNNKPICFIDIKISNTIHLGAISLGSLVNFNSNGYYICVSKKNHTPKFISHDAVVDAVKNNKELLFSVVKGRKKGYPVTWEGENLTSEYFIPGKKLAQFK